MNRDNTEKLVQAFPKLFADVGGFECDDGWFQLIWDLSSKIEPMLTGDMRAAQIKEKFGGLRFYMRESNDQINRLINDAEQRSYVTCERCGHPGKLRKGNWLLVLCDTHHNERYPNK